MKAIIYSIIILTFSIAQGQTINLIANPQNTLVSVGEKFNVTIQIEAGSEEFNGAQFTLNFDPQFLKITSDELIASDIFSFVNRKTFDNTEGKIEFLAGILGSSQTGTFDILSFEVEALEATSSTEFIYDLDPSITVPTALTTTATTEALGTTAAIGITINSNPTIAITSPTDNADITRATDVTFTALASDNEDDDSTLQVSWEPDGVFVTNSTGATITTQLLQPGMQTITATVTDSNGASNSSSITVNVSNPELAIITPAENAVLNSKDVTFELNPTGMDLTLDHFHFYINPADINNLTPEERINTTDQPGVATFTYGEADNIQEGNNTVVIVIASQFHAEFTNTQTVLNFVVDSTPPEITLNGDNPLELSLNDTYNEPGATATDAQDGVINDITIDNSEVDTSTLGTYTVTYEATDAAGNTGMVTRTVNVSTTLAIDTTNVIATQIRVFPNPTNDRLFIQLPKNSRMDESTIYAIDGRRIKTIKNTTQKATIDINVSQFEAGVYLFTSKLNGQEFFKRFTKK